MLGRRREKHRNRALNGSQKCVKMADIGSEPAIGSRVDSSRHGETEDQAPGRLHGARGPGRRGRVVGQKGASAASLFGPVRGPMAWTRPFGGTVVERPAGGAVAQQLAPGAGVD